MAQLKDSPIAARVREALVDQPGFLRDILQATLQRLLEEEITLHLNADPHERTEERRGYRNGYRPRQLKTRVGTLQLLVPLDREGTFKTELFDRYQRSEKALVSTLMEMYLEGVGLTRSCGPFASSRYGAGEGWSHGSQVFGGVQAGGCQAL